MIRSVKDPGRVRSLVMLCLALGLGLLVVRHWAHALGVLPYLFLLACPLLHLLGHGSHGGHGGHARERRASAGGAPT